MLKRSWKTRVAGVSAAGAVLVMAVAGCTSNSDNAEPGHETGSGKETREVNVAVLPTSNMAAVYLGEDQGLFAEQGLKLNLTTVGGGAEMIAGLQAASFDFVVAGYVPLFAAAGNGLPLSIIAANDVGGATPDEEWQTVLVSADSSAQSARDLAGATIGVNALRGVAEATIRASLREQGVDDGTVKFVEIPFSEVPAALANGTVDAAFGSEPFITRSLADGGRIVDTPSYNLGKNFPNGAWATSTVLVEDDPDLVERFTTAIVASVDMAAKNSDAVREILPTFTALTPELAEHIRLPVFRSELDRPQLDKLVSILKASGVIEKEPDLDKLLRE